MNVFSWVGLCAYLFSLYIKGNIFRIMACYCFGIFFFFKSRIWRTFLKVLLARRDRSPVSPDGFYCSCTAFGAVSKIATLLGLAASRRATDWLWVETDTDDCAFFLLLWTALNINDYKSYVWKRRNENAFIPSFSRSPILTIFLITFTLFLSVNAKQYRSKSRPTLL